MTDAYRRYLAVMLSAFVIAWPLFHHPVTRAISPFAISLRTLRKRIMWHFAATSTSEILNMRRFMTACLVRTGCYAKPIFCS